MRQIMSVPPMLVRLELELLLRQLVEQCLRLFQITRVEPFGKPAVDGSEKIAGLILLAPIAPEPCHAHCELRCLIFWMRQLPPAAFSVLHIPPPFPLTQKGPTMAR